MESVLRNLFLSLSKNKWATSLAKKHGLKMGAKRFVSGESLNTAVKVTHQLNKQGIMTTMDHLGEFVHTVEEAEMSMKACIDALEAIHKEKLQANLSVKLTQLGLDISKELCLKNMRAILDKAKDTNGFVRIDMEDHSRNEDTIHLFSILKAEYPPHVGLVMQAYLYKTEADFSTVGEANLRICKGAYKESPQVAYPEKSDVDDNFFKLVTRRLSEGHYTGIATHDEKLIQKIIRFVKQNSIPSSQFEFQMLYGIRNDLLADLVKKGYNARIYIPYGNDWYGYFMRRLAERPANVWFVLKNTIKQ